MDITLNICRVANRRFFPIIARLFTAGPGDESVSPRMKEFRKKLREKSPMAQLDDQPLEHPAQEKEPLEAWPDNTNPHTGEINGPRGPEPTRYGDWERKGRVSDF